MNGTQLGIALVVALAGGCSGTTVPLVRTAGMPWTLTPAKAIPLEVVTQSTAVRDPLPVTGSSVAYGELEEALGLAVMSAAAPWADAHRGKSPNGYQILVELTNAEAEQQGARVLIALTVRAALRERMGNLYLGQTQAQCHESVTTAPAQGAGVVYACMSHIGRELAGWVEATVP